MNGMLKRAYAADQLGDILCPAWRLLTGCQRNFSALHQNFPGVLSATYRTPLIVQHCRLLRLPLSIPKNVPQVLNVQPAQGTARDCSTGWKNLCTKI